MYLLHIPLDYDKENAQPLVINLHGHGATDYLQESQTGMSILADHEDFIVAYPQGTIGQDHHTGWNTGPITYPHVNDILFINNLITYLETTLCIDPDRIYATGFSNGGGMTNVLACKLSDRIAAFAIVSGAAHPIEGGCHPTHPVSILDIHGTHDNVVPYIGNPANDYEPPISQWLEDWAKLDSCTNGPTILAQEARITSEKWTHCKEGATIIHYRIQGGIHVWPSLATDRGALNATPIIWSFLKNYSLKSPAKL
jgi:polyhydroxybutyrate depolymerase